jgi:hypothetical protein
MNNQANRTVATSARTRRTVLRKHMLAVPVLIAVLAGSAVGVNATDDTDPDDTELDGLVTEEVEPGVERIISDDAGHDLDETHPTYRYDMDSVNVASDGSVLVQSSHTRSDNHANPPGFLLWTLGEPGTFRMPHDFSYDLTRPRIAALICDTTGVGVICVDETGDGTTTYLAGTPINDVAVAPDGTVWAVGGYDGDNGGLYHITPD